MLLLFLMLIKAHSHVLEFGGGKPVASYSDHLYLYVAKEERFEKYAWADIQTQTSEQEITAVEKVEYGLNSQQVVQQIETTRVVFSNLQNMFQLYDAATDLTQSYMEQGFPFLWNSALIYPHLFYTSTSQSLKIYNWETSLTSDITTLLPHDNMYIKATSFDSTRYALLVYQKNQAIFYYLVNKSNPSVFEEISLAASLITFSTNHRVAATLHKHYMVIVSSEITKVYRYDGASMQEVCALSLSTVFLENQSNTLHITDQTDKFHVAFGLADYHSLTVLKSDHSCTVQLHSVPTTEGDRKFAYFYNNALYVFDQGVNTTVFTTNTTSTTMMVVSNSSTLPFMIALAVTIPTIILAMVIIFLCCTKRRGSATTRPYVPWNIESIMKAQTPFDFTKQEAECPICLEAVKTVSIKTHCEHVFHNQCMRTWLQTKDTCPMCRSPLLP